MSDKIFINFTKYEYDECVRRLKSEIDTYVNKADAIASNGSNGIVNTASSGTTAVVAKQSSVENWSEEKVNKWFAENKIDTRIEKEFCPCTGIVLKQLYDMRNDAPEFYFQSLNTNKKIEIKNVLVFTHLLRKLFD